MSDEEVLKLNPFKDVNIADSILPTTKPSDLHSSKVKSYSKRQPLIQLNAKTPIQLRKILTPINRVYLD